MKINTPDLRYIFPIDSHHLKCIIRLQKCCCRSTLKTESAASVRESEVGGFSLLAAVCVILCWERLFPHVCQNAAGSGTAVGVVGPYNICKTRMRKESRDSDNKTEFNLVQNQLNLLKMNWFAQVDHKTGTECINYSYFERETLKKQGKTETWKNSTEKRALEVDVLEGWTQTEQLRRRLQPVSLSLQRAEWGTTINVLPLSARRMCPGHVFTNSLRIGVLI